MGVFGARYSARNLFRCQCLLEKGSAWSAPSGVPRIYAALIAPENIGGRVQPADTPVLMLSGQPAPCAVRARIV